MTTVLILFYLYRMADQRLYKLVKWCKSLPLFKNIMVRQWDKLNSSPRSPNVCVFVCTKTLDIGICLFTSRSSRVFETCFLNVFV